MKGVETMEEKKCKTCRHGYLPFWASPCNECVMLGDDYEKYWEPKRCLNCRHADLPSGVSPCKECVMSGDDYEYWEPEEPEKQKRSAADAGQQGKSFLEFMKRRMPEKENRPKPLPISVYYYERENSRIPDSVRVSFEDGTTAVYTLHVDQPKPLVMESIREWRSEEYQYVPRRRRRSRK